MKKKQLIRFLCFATLLLGVGCTEVDVKYPEGTKPTEPDPDTESLVVVTPSSAMPAGTKYYFYDSRTGKAVSATNTKTDGSFEGKMAFGTYRLLAVSDGADNSYFKNMDTYADAAVQLKSAGAESTYKQPGNLQYLALDEVKVEEGKTAEYAAAPQSPVHTLALTLDLSAVSGTIEGLSGTMNGFLPAVVLSSGKPVDGAAAATSFLYFEETPGATRAGNATLTLRSLGLQSPVDVEGKPVYESKMQLRISTSAAGAGFEATLDLTEALSKLAVSGELPGDIDLAVKVEEPEPEDGILTITPSEPMPAGTHYYIYDASGAKVGGVDSDANGNLAATDLVEGSYSVLGIPAGLTLSGMDSYVTATVSLPGQSGSPAPFAGPLSIVRASFEMVNGQTTDLTPAPETLVHTLIFSFEATAPSAVTSLWGSINGVLGSVTLADGQPVASAIAGAGASRLSFTAASSGDKWTVTLYTLGVLNPSNATGSYSAIANLSAVTASHGERTTTADLSTELSALAAGQTVVPTGETVSKAVVFPNDPDVEVPGAGGSVGDWNPATPGDEVELN